MGAYDTTMPEPGTTAGSCGSTARRSSATASLRRATQSPSFRRDKVRRRRTPKSQRKGGAKRTCVHEIPPKPFQRGHPLNSTALLRLKSTKEKRRTTPTSIVSEGHRIVSCLEMKYLRNSRHMISPQMHCHQSPKHLRDKYALTISPFLVD